MGSATDRNSLFTLAWNSYKLVHGMVLIRMVPPLFTLATIIDVSPYLILVSILFDNMAMAMHYV